MLCLVGRFIAIAPAIISSLTGIRSITNSSYSCNLLYITCFHFQTIGECCGLACGPDVVSRGKPDVNNLKCFVTTWVHYFVDCWVPVQRLVLLNIASVPWSIPQIFIRHIRPHGAGGGGSIEPVDMITQAVWANLGQHQRICAHSSRGQEVHLETSGLHQQGQGGDEDHEQHCHLHDPSNLDYQKRIIEYFQSP